MHACRKEPEMKKAIYSLWTLLLLLTFPAALGIAHPLSMGNGDLG